MIEINTLFYGINYKIILTCHTWNAYHGTVSNRHDILQKESHLLTTPLSCSVWRPWSSLLQSAHSSQHSELIVRVGCTAVESQQKMKTWSFLIHTNDKILSSTFQPFSVTLSVLWLLRHHDHYKCAPDQCVLLLSHWTNNHKIHNGCDCSVSRGIFFFLIISHLLGLSASHFPFTVFDTWFRLPILTSYQCRTAASPV